MNENGGSTDIGRAAASFGIRMPKYHFDLIDHVTIADYDGRECDDDADAMDFGERLVANLRQLKPELMGRNYAVLVTDENGEEIYRTPIDVIRPDAA